MDYQLRAQRAQLGSLHLQLLSDTGPEHNLALGNAGQMEKEARSQSSPSSVPETPLANPGSRIPPLPTWTHSAPIT